MFRLVRYGQSMVPRLDPFPSRSGRSLVSPPLPLDGFIPEAHFFQINPLPSKTPQSIHSQFSTKFKIEQ